MQVWDQGGHGYVRYSAAMLGLQHMGYVAENRVIQAALAHRLKRPGNLTASLLPVGALKPSLGFVCMQQSPCCISSRCHLRCAGSPGRPQPAELHRITRCAAIA